MSSYQNNTAGSASGSGALPPLTETRLSATTMLRASELTKRTEDNLAKKRAQLEDAHRQNVRGQKDSMIKHLEHKIRNIEAGLRTGAVEQHQRKDIADAQLLYEYAKAAEHNELRATVGKQPVNNNRYLPPEIAGPINDLAASQRMNQHRNAIRKDYREAERKQGKH